MARRGHEKFHSKRYGSCQGYLELSILPEDGALRILIKDGDSVGCLCLDYEDYTALHKALGKELRTRKKNGNTLTEEKKDDIVLNVDQASKPQRKKRTKKPAPAVGTLDMDALKAIKIEEAMK